MSKHLQRFVDNFLKGAALGSHWMEFAERADDRKAQREIARERNRITSQHHRERMEIDRQKAADYGTLSRAQAGYYNRKGAGGGGGAGAGGLSAGSQSFLDDMRGSGLDVSPVPDRQPLQTTPAEPEPTLTAPPDTSPDIAAARGGRIRGRQMAGQIMQAGIGAAARMNRPQVVPGEPTMTRRPSMPVPPVATGSPIPLQANGSNGPGSGYGQQAPPPVAAAVADQPVAIQPTYEPEGTYRRGGRVRRYAAGGMVDDVTPPEGRIVYDEQGQPIYLTQGDVAVPYNPQYGGGKYGGETRGGATYGGQKFGGQKFGGETYGGATPGGATPGGWRHTTVPPRVTRDPGETGGYPERPEERGPMGPGYPVSSPEEGWQAEQTMPTTTVRGTRGGGQAIATNEPWKKLGDQTRTAAYEPYARDIDDERNQFVVDREMRAQPWTQQRVIMDEQGKVARVENPVRGGQPAGAPTAARGPAAPAGGATSTNNAAADYQSGAVSYAQAIAKDHPQEVYSGAGAPDPKTMEQVMQVIDPEGKMPVADRMTNASKAVHEWYLSQGTPDAANRASFEIAQYGVGQSRPHGVAAAKAAQQGDLQGAVQQLIQGFDWLPNEQKATVEGSNIVVVGKDGKPVRTIPINPQSVTNLALGMATGKLGWDAMGYPQQGGGGPSPPSGQPPPAGAAPPGGARRSAAQPPAAPAGPSTPPAATTQAITPAVPKPPAAPPAPRAGAAPPPAATTAQPAQKPPEEGTKTQAQKAEPDDEEAQLRKDPRKPLTTVDRLTSQDDPAHNTNRLQTIKNDLRKTWMAERKAIEAQAAKKVPRNEWSKVVTPTLQKHQLEYDRQVKEVDDRMKSELAEHRQQQAHDRQVESRPRDVNFTNEAQMKTAIDDRLKVIDADKVGRKNTVLEHLKNPADRQPVYDLARQIWQQNKGLSMEQATDYAVGVTSIKPTGESAMNFGKGPDALQFTARGNQRRGYSLTLPSGERILVDHNAFNNIHTLQKKNWRAYTEAQKTADKEKTEKENAKKYLGIRAGRAILDMWPSGASSVPFPKQ